jgi:hypothetical protein
MPISSEPYTDQIPFEPTETGIILLLVVLHCCSCAKVVVLPGCIWKTTIFENAFAFLACLEVPSG